MILLGGSCGEIDNTENTKSYSPPTVALMFLVGERFAGRWTSLYDCALFENLLDILFENLFDILFDTLFDSLLEILLLSTFAFEAVLAANTLCFAALLFDRTGATMLLLAMMAFFVAVKLLISDFFWIDMLSSVGMSEMSRSI